MLGDRPLPAFMRSKGARLVDKHRQRRVKLRTDHRAALLAVTAAERGAADAAAALEQAERRALAFGEEGPGKEHAVRLGAAKRAEEDAVAQAARLDGAIDVITSEINIVARDHSVQLQQELQDGHDKANARLEAALAAAHVELAALSDIRAASQDVAQAAGDHDVLQRLADQPKSLRAVMEAGLPWPLVRGDRPEPVEGRPPEPRVRGWRSGINEGA